MNNFLDFINNDVETKKNLISSLPTKTKTNIKKYNETVDEYISKYKSYKESVYKYINAKYKSLKPKSNSNIDIKEYEARINNLEKIKSLFNPLNTYYEKMEFDELIYRISNYYVFNFDSVDSIINEFIDKFVVVGIDLTEADFNYTYYVNKYMSVFLSVRNNKKSTKEELDQVFEELYWSNPDLISHIEINFRKLIKKYSRKFEEYILRRQKEVSRELGINNYNECIQQITDTYCKKNEALEETISEIVEKAINKEFDVSQLLENNKIRKSAFSSLIPEEIDNEVSMNKIYSSLDKLKDNLNEYNIYVEIAPLIDDFKSQYANIVTLDNKNNSNELKTVEVTIRNKENELDRLNKKVFKSNSDNKALKMESIRRAKELYDLYKKYDQEYFKAKILSILNIDITVSDLIDLYYSFDCYKKINIQRVYKLNTYDEVIKQSKLFDSFAEDPTNNIVKGLPVFEENNIPRIIANKYKLSNIKILESDIVPENINALTNKILLITRINKINKSNMDVEQVWFIANAFEIISKEEGK